MKARVLALTLGIACTVGCAHVETPRERALLLLAHGRIPQGIVELEKIRDAHPDDPQAHIDLGHGYELAHRYDEALAAYDRAAEVKKTDPRGPREGGLRCAAWGEHEAAIPRLEEAIHRGDQDPRTFHALGFSRLQRGDKKGAREAYTAGLATKDGDRDATCVLGLATLAVIDEDGKEALRWYEELIKRRPKHAGAHLGRAWALTKLGRHGEADAALAEAVELGATAQETAKLRVWMKEQRGPK